MDKKILAFDCYGTLVDTASFEAEIGRIAKKNGLDGKQMQAIYACNEAGSCMPSPSPSWTNASPRAAWVGTVFGSTETASWAFPLSSLIPRAKPWTGSCRFSHKLPN